MHNNLIDKDLEYILAATEQLWEELRGKRIFITGGTGFFGRWLLKSFAKANTNYNLNAEAVVLTRDPNSFKSISPHLASNSAIKLHVGDIKDFVFPDGEFSHVLHLAATSAQETFNNRDLLEKFDTLVGGTRRVLDFAVSRGAKKFLYTSSGVVYGKQPEGLTHIPEDYNGAPDPIDMKTLSAWGTSKRTAEFICAYYAAKHNIEVKIARCFTFIGPGLPLDIHYAIGNFIRDGMKGGPIKIQGDGAPIRSYQYISDLTVWLWTILFKGEKTRPYNVGSEEAVSIGELAEIVAKTFPQRIEVEIAKSADPNASVDRYVPSTRRACEELNLKQTVDLKEAIRRTIEFNSQQ